MYLFTPKWLVTRGLHQTIVLSSLAWALQGSLARADSFEWADPVSGVFDQASNWNRLSGTRFIPAAGDLATFNEAGTYEVLFTAPEETGVLNVDAGNVTFHGDFGSQTYTITGDGADVNVVGGTLTLGKTGEPLGVMVGDDLDVVQGGTLSVLFGSLLDVDGVVTVGQQSGTSSTITVDGQDSHIDFADRLNLGAAQATGTLTLSNDATGVIAGAVNLASSLTNNVTGRLNVLSGATLETGSIDVAAPLLIGSNLDGELKVDGRDSLLTMTGAATLKIGRDGHSGTVTVSDEGEFVTGTGGTIVGNGGTLMIDGSASLYFGIFTEFDAKGGLLVNSGGTLTLQGGRLRVSGDLDNTGGGTFDFRYGAIQVTAGTFSPADTTYTIASQVADESLDLTISSGSTWSNASTITVGNLNAGSLTISRGTVATTNLDVRDTGRLSMGSDAQLNTTSAEIRGIATIGGGSSFNTATWTNTDRIDVLGELTVRTGGELIVDDLNPSGDGVIVVDGGSITATRIWNPFDFRRGSVTINSSVQIGGTGFQPFESSLTLDPQQHLTTPDTTQIRSFFSLALNGGSLVTNNLDVDGEFHFQSGTLELTGGTLTGLNHLTVPTGGKFRAIGNYSISILGVVGSTIEATGDLTLGDSVRVNGFGSGGNLVVGSHTVVLQDANDVVFDSLALVTLGQSASPGTLTAANGLTLDFGGNVTGFGELDTPDDPATPLINNGHIAGESLSRPITLSGYVKGVGTCDNCMITGTDAPGFSTAAVSRGSVHYNGTLEIELGGLTPGSGFDQLNHLLGGGIADLGGTLDIQLLDNFVPSAGNTFEIITAATVLGEFDTLNLPSLPADLMWFLNYSSTSVQLVSTYGSDFDEDGDVDDSDLVAWETGYGSSPAVHGMGDANSDALANGFDFLVWQRQFGSSGSSSATPVIAIPEPASLLLTIAAGVLLCTSSRIVSGPRRASLRSELKEST